MQICDSAGLTRLWINELLAMSFRRSYQATNSLVPSGFMVIVGCHWSFVVVSELTRIGEDQLVPPFVDWMKKMSPFILIADGERRWRAV